MSPAYYPKPGDEVRSRVPQPEPAPAMVQRVCAHLGTVRHRTAVVEYRIEQHRKSLGKRLEALERAP